ncbi:hypothetical protein FOL47_003887 [Perkinsus chesapeaki]|uniref:Uncharacterized protein n=1 Tax=Perkinsus chesapeaki TaxID=330153 RepID=A0A7J6M5N9_PERCH|nr:hypothetical protein FOL47_003887 [Perkinsus chesapeaki]
MSPRRRRRGQASNQRSKKRPKRPEEGEDHSIARRALPVSGAPYEPREGEASCFEDMPDDANEYLKRVMHQRSSGPQSISVDMSSERVDAEDDDGSRSISSFASFICVDTPILPANYRHGVKDSEEVEEWLKEFRELRERMMDAADSRQNEEIIFTAPPNLSSSSCSSSTGPEKWSDSYFIELGAPTEDVVVEIDSAGAVVGLETVAKAIGRTARISRSRQRRPAGDLSFVEWCIWCYALMLRIEHPLMASTASDMQMVYFLMCPFRAFCLFVAALGAMGITWFTMNKINLMKSSSSLEGAEDTAKVAVKEESLYRALAKRIGIALLVAFHCDLIMRLGYTQCALGFVSDAHSWLLNTVKAL